jgi:hypothetical protein
MTSASITFSRIVRVDEIVTPFAAEVKVAVIRST